MTLSAMDDNLSPFSRDVLCRIAAGETSTPHGAGSSASTVGWLIELGLVRGVPRHAPLFEAHGGERQTITVMGWDELRLTPRGKALVAAWALEEKEPPNIQRVAGGKFKAFLAGLAVPPATLGLTDGLAVPPALLGLTDSLDDAELALLELFDPGDEE